MRKNNSPHLALFPTSDGSNRLEAKYDMAYLRTNVITFLNLHDGDLFYFIFLVHATYIITISSKIL